MIAPHICHTSGDINAVTGPSDVACSAASPEPVDTLYPVIVVNTVSKADRVSSRKKTIEKELWFTTQFNTSSTYLLGINLLNLFQSFDDLLVA